MNEKTIFENKEDMRDCVLDAKKRFAEKEIPCLEECLAFFSNNDSPWVEMGMPLHNLLWIRPENRLDFYDDLVGLFECANCKGHEDAIHHYIEWAKKTKKVDVAPEYPLTDWSNLLTTFICKYQEWQVAPNRRQLKRLERIKKLGAKVSKEWLDKRIKSLATCDEILKSIKA